MGHIRRPGRFGGDHGVRRRGSSSHIRRRATRARRKDRPREETKASPLLLSLHTTLQRRRPGDSQATCGQLHQRVAEGDQQCPKTRVPGEETRCLAAREGQTVAKMARGPQTVLCQGEGQIHQGHEQDRAGHPAGQRRAEPCCCRGFQYGTGGGGNRGHHRRGLRGIVGRRHSSWSGGGRHGGSQSGSPEAGNGGCGKEPDCAIRRRHAGCDPGTSHRGSSHDPLQDWRRQDSHFGRAQWTWYIHGVPWNSSCYGPLPGISADFSIAHSINGKQ